MIEEVVNLILTLGLLSSDSTVTFCEYNCVNLTALGSLAANDFEFLCK